MNETAQICYIRSIDCPQGAFLPKRVIRISPDDRGFYFADGVYEVMRTYAGRLFRLKDHLNRFKNSLAAVRIPLSEIDLIGEICMELLARNNLKVKDVFFYIQATRGVWDRNLLFPPPSVPPTLYISVAPIIHPIEEQQKGIKTITVPDIRWHRCDIKAIGLLPSVLARQSALEAGATEALFVRTGFLTEGTHTNLFGVKNGTVLTHPLNNHILPGVTRTVLLELCNRERIPVSETAIPETDLFQLDELFVTSTTWEVVPVTIVNGRPIGNGKPGPLTRQLQEAFTDYVREEIK